MPPTISPTRVSSKDIKQQQLDGTLKNIEMRHYQYSKKKISIKEIEKLATTLRNSIINNGYHARIQLVINTPFGHRSGKFVNIQDANIHVWNPNDFVYSTTEGEETNTQEWYDDGNAIPSSFFFNVIKTEGNAGGCSGDGNNDCFYECLVKVFGKTITEYWDTPGKLKKYLKIKRNNLVNAEEHLDKIEKHINIQLCVEGDTTRLPKINSKMSLHLTLTNAHYKVAPASLKSRVKGVAYKEQKPLTYNYDYDTDTCLVYDGEKEYTKDITYVREQMRNRLSSQYIILKVKDKSKLKEEYNIFKEQADMMKEHTQGLVNMYKSGSIKNTALALFQHFTKHITEPDKIHGVEAGFLLNTYRGGLMNATPYEGEGYSYDVNSMYASIMSSLLNLPYKQGMFLVLTAEDMKKWKTDKGIYFKYGIYRCKIEGEINPVLFKSNPEDTYTHIDLALAHHLGYTITLTEDGKANFLSYEGKTRLSGKALFKEYIDLLYPIKKKYKGVKVSKPLINILWGALSEKRIHKKKYSTLEDNTALLMEYDEEIENCVILGEDSKGDTKVKYETVKRDDMFVSGFGRLMPFITAQARSIMVHLILNNLDEVGSVKRIHTDGFVSSVPLKKTCPNKQDSKMGELVYEGKYEHVVIKNMRKPVGVLVE